MPMVPLPVERAVDALGSVTELAPRTSWSAPSSLSRAKRVEIVRAVARAASIDWRVRRSWWVRSRIARRWTRGWLPGPDVASDRHRPRPLLRLAAHIELLADAVAHLLSDRAQTSAALLRVLAQGRPTIMGDLEHLSDVPRDAVVRADVSDEEGETTRAILKLASAPSLRGRLGQAARAFVARAHAPARTAEAYARAIELAAARPRPPVSGWPSHWAALARS